MRIRLPHAKGDAQLLRQIQQSISPLQGVKRVEVNPVTGGAVIHYDADQHEDFHSFLAEHAAGEELFALKPPELTEADEFANKLEAEAEFLATHSETARGIVNFVKQIDAEIKKATGNNLDLKVLVPLGLAIWAFVEAEADVATPLWLTLGIFSFNSFVSLHHPQLSHSQASSAAVAPTSAMDQVTPTSRRTGQMMTISEIKPARKRS